MRPLRQSEEQWLFPISTLHQTPSQDAGMSYVDEMDNRATAIRYLRSLAWRTQLSRGRDDVPDYGGRAKGVLTVAATLVHRFYMRRSIQDFPPKIMAPTILFIASKIEEEPVKLRMIVNCCLTKFDGLPDEKTWNPTGDHSYPSPEYSKWENEVLACEEITHEALCFDMTVAQPWPIFQDGVKGLDVLWADGVGPIEYGEEMPMEAVVADEPIQEAEDGEVDESHQGSQGRNERRANRKAKLNEMVINNLGWPLLSELYMYPLPVLYHPNIIAFACFRLCMQALIPNEPFADGLVDHASRFGLDAETHDLEMIENCLRDIRSFVRPDGLIREGPILERLWYIWENIPPQDSQTVPTPPLPRSISRATSASPLAEAEQVDEDTPM